jgi:hypothetical protein
MKTMPSKMKPEETKTLPPLPTTKKFKLAVFIVTVGHAQFLMEYRFRPDEIILDCAHDTLHEATRIGIFHFDDGIAG